MSKTRTLLLPNWLYSFKDNSKSKSVSPVAVFRPAGAMQGKGFESSTSPSQAPTQKIIIIQKPLVYWDGYVGNTIAFIAKMKQLGFDVRLCLEDGQFKQVDNQLSDVSSILTEAKLAKFNPKIDYQNLGTTIDNTQILDGNQIAEIADCLRGEEQMDDVSAMDGFEARGFAFADDKEKKDFLQGERNRNFLLILRNTPKDQIITLVDRHYNELSNKDIYDDLFLFAEILKAIPNSVWKSPEEKYEFIKNKLTEYQKNSSKNWLFLKMNR